MSYNKTDLANSMDNIPATRLAEQKSSNLHLFLGGKQDVLTVVATKVVH